MRQPSFGVEDGDCSSAAVAGLAPTRLSWVGQIGAAESPVLNPRRIAKSASTDCPTFLGGTALGGRESERK